VRSHSQSSLLIFWSFVANLEELITEPPSPCCVFPLAAVELSVNEGWVDDTVDTADKEVGCVGALGNVVRCIVEVNAGLSIRWLEKRLPLHIFA
jgi:hypothetical protein